MGSIPYLLIFAIFGFVLYWYARRAEADSDASKGIFGIGRDKDDEEEVSDELSPREKIQRLSKRQGR